MNYKDFNEMRVLAYFFKFFYFLISKHSCSLYMRKKMYSANIKVAIHQI